MTFGDWPFDDPPDRLVMTTGDVIDGTDWIAMVSHDIDDGVWQFWGTAGFPGVDAAITACISHVFESDHRIGELADLPLGWVAERLQPNGSWHRKPCDS